MDGYGYISDDRSLGDDKYGSAMRGVRTTSGLKRLETLQELKLLDAKVQCDDDRLVSDAGVQGDSEEPVRDENHVQKVLALIPF